MNYVFFIEKMVIKSKGMIIFVTEKDMGIVPVYIYLSFNCIKQKVV